MDKNAIKKYAIWARRELIERVAKKAQQYGIEENAEILLNLEINPVIPNAIIINPIIQNWNPTKNERASKKKINPIPRSTVIAPIAKATIENGIS